MINCYIQKLKHSQLSRDILYVFLGQIAIMLSVFGVNKIIGYYMGVESFAIYSLIKRAGGLVACITQGGLTIALPRYIARFSSETKQDKFISLQFSTGALLLISAYCFLVTVVAVLFPEHFSFVFFQQDEVDPMLICTVLVFAFGQTYSNLLFSYYQGLGKFHKYNVAQFICSSICLLSAFIFRSNLNVTVIVSYSILLLIGLAPMVLAMSYGRAYIRTPDFNPHQSIKKIVTIKLIKYGLPRMAHDMMLFAQDVIPLIIVLHRFDMHTVGLYSAGLSIPLTISPLFAFTGGVFLQRVSLLIKRDDWESINKIINAALVIFLGIALVGTVVLILSKNIIVTIMYADSFNEVISLVPFFALSLIPRAIYLLYRNPLDAVSVRPYNLYIVSIRTIVLVIMLVLSESVMDCAKAYMYSSVVMAIMPLVFWYKIKK